MLAVFLLLPQKQQAQSADTLRLMTYNLLYYRELTLFCTNSNNNANAKDGYMEDIMDHVDPDILVVNEMSKSQTNAPFTLLNSAINKNGRNFWFSNTSANASQSIVNVLYFNQDKFVLDNQYAISQDLSSNDLVRNIDLYTLYYKDSNLVYHQDTTFFYIIAAHLKSGSSSSDATERGKATEAVMAHLDSINASGNYFFMGDLNLYNSSEAAYQDLINYVSPAYRFYDPVNAPGNWGNSGYAILHTQSTHTSGGCFAGGGMDDRFDFILASDEVMNNTDKVEYINNTYSTVGQDGNRYNGSLISPTNNSAPSTVINALYNMSDHLPVALDVRVTLPPATALKEHKELSQLKFQNPTMGLLTLDFGKEENAVELVEVYSFSGQMIKSKKHKSGRMMQMDVNELPDGLYFLYIRLKSGNQKVEKLMKI